MGCGTSIISSKPSSSSLRGGTLRNNRTKRRISSLFCGSFFSKSTVQLEDRPELSPILTCTENNSSQNGIEDRPELSSILTCTENNSSQNGMLERGSASYTNDNTDSSDLEEVVLESDPSSIQRSTDHNDSSSSNQPRYQEPTSPVSDSFPRFPTRDDRSDVATTSSFFDSNDMDMRSTDLLLLDMVNISSNLLTSSITEINRRESRRNSRRLFLDALSRRNFMNLSDSSSAIFFATDLSNTVGSHDRWRRVDMSSRLYYSGTGDSLASFAARLNPSTDQRLLLGSEISERVTSDFNDERQRTAHCASGLHVEGTCLCNSFFSAEESGTLASISQIIMLADALFEVLDEIHNQSLTLSLSTLSLPAPESVVEAFPLKYHNKMKSIKSEPDDPQQCHICLSDLEEGDKLRVLPCNHEYHAPCIDKWLKEVNRVCPVCRRNVCEGSGECSISNEEVLSL